MTVVWSSGEGRAGRTARIERQDVSYRVVDFFGSVAQTQAGPQVFLVVQRGVTRPHFHRVEQFQVFLAGRALLGKKLVVPPSLHYTDPWSSYGPIMSEKGDQEISYLTIRQRADVGAFYMPKARDMKQRRSGRHLTIEIPYGMTGPGTGSHRPMEPPRDRWTELIRRYNDGLAATYKELSPQAHLRLPPRQRDGGTRVGLIVGGSLSNSAVSYPAWSCFYDSCDDRGPESGRTVTEEFRADDGGANVLVMDFPRIG